MNRGRGWLLVLAALALAVPSISLRAVRPGERMVVRRFGRLVDPAWEPGLHWAWPLGIDRCDLVRTDLVRRLVVGTPNPADEAADPASGEFLTGDLNLVHLQLIVQYRVANPTEFVVAAEPAEAILNRLAEAGVSRALARRGIDSVLRADRQQIGEEVKHDLEEAASSHRLGLEILGASLTEARPPPEVAADFSAAQSAQSRRDERATVARTEAETSVTSARAMAHARQDAARAAAQRKLLAARAESQKFLALLAEARRSRELTIERIYLDAMNSLLAKVRRKIVLPAGDAVDLTVLGLDE
jgi:membrane protease subunit HflK